MGSQGFRNIAGNPFVYQEDTRSAAFGLDAAAQKWKLSVKATAGALPTDTAQLTIDPATNGNVTIDPNGTGSLVIASGNVQIDSGNIYFSNITTSVSQVLMTMTTGAGLARFMHITGGNEYSLFLGYSCGTNVTTAVKGNTFVGSYCAPNLVNTGGGFKGSYNTGFGSGSMPNATTASFNGSFGGSFQNLTSGIENCCFSAYTGAYRLTTGSYNTIIGMSDTIIGSDERYWGAGYNYTGSESSNICIGSAGTTGDSNVLRIGSSGSGVGQVNKAFIAGTYGVTPGGTLNLALVDSNGQLGSTATLSPALGGKMTWTTATANATAAVNTGYLIKHATPATKLTITLPATAALYSEIEIDGYTAGMWKLTQASGQTIHFGSIDTTTGTGGYIEATNKYDSVKIRCVVADTEFLVISSVGTLTVA